MARTRGKVKWFNDEKGFGFVSRDDGQKDCFVHHSAIEKTAGERASLEEDEPVEFDVVIAERGPKAENVKRLRPRS